MVYMDPGELGWRPCVKTWITKFADKMKEETVVRCCRNLFRRCIWLLVSTCLYVSVREYSKNLYII